MKKISKMSVLAVALAMLSTASAHAGGKSDFTPTILGKVQSSKDGLDKLRVYLNRELIVVRKGLIRSRAMVTARRSRSM
ncbi:MAG: hypothetical protein HY075_08020 [Deltaproteobacteria bacterium]|nr:hypothetical protein [Deltaproteobacteria bacterium]